MDRSEELAYLVEEVHDAGPSAELFHLHSPVTPCPPNPAQPINSNQMIPHTAPHSTAKRTGARRVTFPLHEIVDAQSEARQHLEQLLALPSHCQVLRTLSERFQSTLPGGHKSDSVEMGNEGTTQEDTNTHRHTHMKVDVVT